MGQTRYYSCSFTPIGQYFFGGEKTFPFDPTGQAQKKVYYITSEDFPSQSTVFGAIRFMLLEKAGLLNNGITSSSSVDLRARQDALIGRDGFSMDKKDSCSPYGILKCISPVYIYDKKTGQRLIPAPLNHKVRHRDDRDNTCSGKGPETQVSQNDQNRSYEPLSMKYLNGISTDLGEAVLIPDNYDAKAGLTDGFLSLDGKNTLVERGSVIGALTQTRIAREMDEGGFFKMSYKYLKGDYAFSVMVEVDIPDGIKGQGGAYSPFKEQGIVYLGMEKSTFRYDVTEIDEGRSFELEQDVSKIHMTDIDDIQVYYALSDCYRKKGMKSTAMFWILQKANLRTLVKQSGTDYRSSMKKSRLYQMIQAGSVFYVKKGEPDETVFLEQFDCPGLKQVGFNHILKTGVKR